MNPVRETVTRLPAIFALVRPKYASRSIAGSSPASSPRDRGPWSASTAHCSDTSSIRTSVSRPIRSAKQAKFGSAAVSTKSLAACRSRTPSSTIQPPSSHQIVYCAWPGSSVRGSRASTPARNASASEPVNRYLNSGDVSKMPAELRTAKYSNFSDRLYFSADR